MNAKRIELAKTLEDLKVYVKAITAFVVGCLQLAQVYFTLSGDGNLSPEDINTIINTAVLVLTGTGLVYLLPNKNKTK